MNYNDLIQNIENFQTQYASEITPQQYFGFPLESLLNAETRLLTHQEKSVAYFSMEYGLAPSIYNTFRQQKPMDERNQFYKHQVFSNYWIADYIFKININKMLDIPIYSGGLGVLAGDTVKSIADLGLSVVALGILWNKGYFKQNFWYKHGQVPEELSWDPTTYPGLIPLKTRVVMPTKHGDLTLRLWKYYVYSHDKKNVCPLILLDSHLPENNEHFRQLTDQLYRSDHVSWRIFQRSILGIGGMKALTALGYNVDTYHLNEGHAAFALLERYVELEDKKQFDQEKKKFVYTCHTPVAAGHDRFHINDIESIFPDEYVQAARLFGHENKDSKDVNLTHICLDNCRHTNAVAQKHGEIMRLQFPDFASRVDAITNGVHSHTWVSQPVANVLDKQISLMGDWRADPLQLVNIDKVRENPEFRQSLVEAHQINKRQLLNVIKPWKLDENYLTICWARRITGYKRPSLLFHDVNQLIKIAKEVGPLQIIIAGKSHPMDNVGAGHISNIMENIDKLNEHVPYLKVLILENYDTYFGKLLTSSVDVWLNNPLPPFEASGTSGMKAIINGVLQLSTLDGWVVEAEHDDIGWIFGWQHHGNEIGSESNLRLEEDSKALYETLRTVASTYYQFNHRGIIDYNNAWVNKMINCLKRSAFFNTQRMVLEYKKKMWDM